MIPEKFPKITASWYHWLELPIDHFRLLGVSPTTDIHTLLQTLEQRIDRPPEQGFTHETLQNREHLLRLSADLLSNPQLRIDYEAELTSLDDNDQGMQAALDVPASQEVPGLLLLLEAGQAIECFDLVYRALQPPQAPALGSGREADLCLLAGLACLKAAKDLRQQRRYETAAHTLLLGIQLLQRMGQQGTLRQQMADALQALRPFRVLDLLSRELGASEARNEGLTMLEDLVQSRGGLEGNDDPQFSEEEFRAFFRQIRTYLTVQEQIDLFSRWSREAGRAGGTADFLATTALTASGFAQRKPDRIASALERLQASGQSDVKPLLASLHLLLGQVDAAEQSFQEGKTPELQQWAQQYGDQPLAQLCAYCRDWLARDVLPGYRDLDADPDLEAYFADRDVQAYLDHLAPLTATPGASLKTMGTADQADEFGFGLFSLSGLEDQDGHAAAQPLIHTDEEGSYDEDDLEDDFPSWPPTWLEPIQARLQGWWRSGAWRRPASITAAAVGVLALSAGIGTMLRNRQDPTPIPVEAAKPTTATTPEEPPSDGAPPASKSNVAATSGEAALPLRADQPNTAEIQQLLEAWLAAKASLLAGKDSTIPLQELARDRLQARVLAERRRDQLRSQTQRIETRVEALKVESMSPRRIAALATLRYSDQRLDADGQPVGSPTRIDKLRNRYVFGRDGGRWRLVSFERAN